MYSSRLDENKENSENSENSGKFGGERKFFAMYFNLMRENRSRRKPSFLFRPRRAGWHRSYVIFFFMNFIEIDIYLIGRH